MGMPTRRHALRGVTVALLLPFLLPGCKSLSPASYTPPVAEDVRGSARTVAVISTVAASDDTAPHLDVPIGPGKEATKGAATGAGTGLLAGVAVSAAGGPLGPVLAPIVIPMFVLGGMAGGGAVGWSTSVPARDVDAANAALRRSRYDLSAELARRIALRLPAVGKVAAPSGSTDVPDLRVEVAIDRWGLAGGEGSDHVTGFFVAASYRVVKTSDGTTIARRSFIEGGPQRTLPAWTGDGAALLSKAIDESLSRVAEAIVDGTFLVYNFRVLASTGLVRGEVCGLKPLSPPPLRRFGPYESGSHRTESLSPRLVWESFPRQVDVEQDTRNVLARVTDVRYDLRVWQDEHGGPGDLVYERVGLNLPAQSGAVSHTMETALAARSSYLWSVRARFKLDGVEHVSRWSYDLEIDLDAIPLGYFGRHGWLGPEDPYRESQALRLPCLDDSIPPLHYFSFRTP